MLNTVGGGLCDTPGVHGTLVSDITSAEWLRPTATRGGLRDAAR